MYVTCVLDGGDCTQLCNCSDTLLWNDQCDSEVYTYISAQIVKMYIFGFSVILRYVNMIIWNVMRAQTQMIRHVIVAI